MLSELDLNLKLLRGKPIRIDTGTNNVCKVHPITLDEIVDTTIEKYYKYINLLCIDDETIKKIIDIDEEITVFEFIYINCSKEEEYRKSIFEAFEFFLREKIGMCEVGFYLYTMPPASYKQLEDKTWHGEILSCKEVFAKGKTKKKCEKLLKEVYINWLIINNKIRIITEEVFKEIVKIIKLQNCLVNKQEEEKFKPANEKARKMLEEMKKNQEELDKAKSKDSLNLCDLVSIFAAYSENMNILDIWNMSFYQFNDQFNRLKIMKEYDANLQILMHCDTSKNKIDLKHWMSSGKGK